MYFMLNRRRRIGKVLWNNIPDDLKGQIWKYEDINDILLKEHHL